MYPPLPRVPETSMYPMVSLPEALRKIENALTEEFGIYLNREQSESVPVRDSIGRISFRDIPSKGCHPPFNASVVDGYAVSTKEIAALFQSSRNEYVPYTQEIEPLKTCSKIPADYNDSHGPENYPILGLNFFCEPLPIFAGRNGNFSMDALPATKRQPPNKKYLLNCSYITTGAAVPCYYDAVIPTEYCFFSAEDNMIEIVSFISAFENQNIRLKGSEIRANSIILKQGIKLDAVCVALLAICGITHVDVRRKISIALISSGDEVIPLPTEKDKLAPTLEPSKIYDSNELLLSALLEKEVLCEKKIHSQDNPSAVAAAFRRFQDNKADVDVIISTGGVSMGKTDYIKPYLEENGKILFGRLNFKPGKPTTVGILPRIQTEGNKNYPFPLKPLLVFALPGNPVSTWATFHLLVQPTLKYLQNYFKANLFSNAQQTPLLSIKSFLPAQVPVVLASVIKPDATRPECHRCILFEVPHEVSLHDLEAMASGQIKPSYDPVVVPQLQNRENFTQMHTPHNLVTKKWPSLGETYLVAVSTGNQISSQLYSCQFANGFFFVPPVSHFNASPGFSPGDEVTAFLLDTPYTDFRTVLNFAPSVAKSIKPAPSNSKPNTEPSVAQHAPAVQPAFQNAQLPVVPSTFPQPNFMSDHKIFSSPNVMDSPSAPFPPKVTVDHSITIQPNDMVDLRIPPQSAVMGGSTIFSQPNVTIDHSITPKQNVYKVGILTVSDSCYQKKAADISGAAIAAYCATLKNLEVVQREVVPDEILAIRECVQNWACSLSLSLIVLTGGTGLSSRDVTPNAIQPLMTTRLSGLEFLMMREGLAKTPLASLSRLSAGSINRSLVLSLPGSPKGVEECLEAVTPVIFHALDILAT